MCTYRNVCLPRLRSKTIPSQLKDLKAKAEENCVFVPYRSHQDTEKHSLQEKLVQPKVVLKSQTAKVISPMQSNSEDLSNDEEIHTICPLSSPVQNTDKSFQHLMYRYS